MRRLAPPASNQNRPPAAGKALHGTYLLDPDGNIVWRAIGNEPYMDAGFLLEESKRLRSLRQGKRLSGG